MPVRRFKGAKAKADFLFSQIIRSLGYCEAEGFDNVKCSTQLHTAHIFSRRFSGTRTDLRAAYCLCFNHHRYFHDHPRQFSRFITTTFAQDIYEELLEKAHTPTKVNWQEVADYLKKIKQRIDSGEISLDTARKYDSM